MLLERCERAMRSTKAEQITFEKPLTIEHLMPQDWTEHWPLRAGTDQLAATQRREVVLQTIGNLTLLTQPLNSAASNAAWDTKRVDIKRYSLLRINEGWPAIWDETEIEKRARGLLAFALKIWSRPSRPNDDALWQPPIGALGGADSDWGRKETILAYALLQASVGFPRDAAIAALAALIHRSPGAVRFKLGNLRAAESNGLTGLPHRSRIDDEVVSEFQNDLAKLRAAASTYQAELQGETAQET